MGASDYLEAALLDHKFKLATFTPPSSTYIALFTAAPSDSGGGTEVSGNAYARVQVTNDATSWTRSSSTVSNSIAITFAAPSPSAWGTVTHYGEFDAPSGGNLLDHGPLTNARSTAVGVALSFAIGELTFTLSQLFLGLLTGGYTASPVDTLNADAEWVWDSVGNAILRPIQIAAAATWTWASTGNLTVSTPTTLEADSTWTWESAGDIDEGQLGPRARARRAGEGGDRDIPATASSSTRGTPGTPGSGAGR